MSFMKLSILILIFNALHFSIKLALKNRKKINEMRNSWDTSALILCIVLIYSSNINNVSQFFRKLHAYSTMSLNILFIFNVCSNLMCKTWLNALIIFKFSMKIMYLISQSYMIWTWFTSKSNIKIIDCLHLIFIWTFKSMWWVSIILLNLLIIIDFKILLMISSKAMSQYVFKSI